MPSASDEVEPSTESTRRLADEVIRATGAWLAETLTRVVFVAEPPRSSVTVRATS